ncbi:MAG: sigma-70 family RNA polymerase sigma factor [Kitasatospora sp.]|jgi:RNA polymerase sigma-70 factor (ECF subfamily)|nr:sigma-70 family RNA polymerase sigma factor [Kitasatospora sp.]
MELLAQAQGGDGEAFARLTDPYRRELQVHCYRILGSVADAEDALQETLLAAWQGIGRFEGRASVRTWLYRIATSRCLNALRSARRRPQMESFLHGVQPPEPTRAGDPVWLEPYPDLLLEGLPDRSPGPEARYETREAISLAFITALQLLPPRQRAVLVLRDVLGFRASEAAHILDTTEESVTSALKRARAALERRPEAGQAVRSPEPGSPAETELVERLTRAFETSDLDSVLTLLTDDVWLLMPPIPLEYQGRDLAARFFSAVAFRPGRRFRAIATRANHQPALGLYVAEPHEAILHANGLVVLTLSGNRIAAMTRFDNAVLPRFGLPRTLPL